ncbi:Predicted Zn-dependent peptidase [Alteribacillus persepolensis]|uniref:Predicted Zn-dependent peptidase n=1 Tax=Alteribacillus persepolensis TaxID=568899 RepID=A0A1G7YTP5_9BACI|nr:pitrilysin family protein [Alteribacillus persepolensis]SDG99893.1 Predicted Zn-dependent peptidase [Alteribacillus persepolensis]
MVEEQVVNTNGLDVHVMNTNKYKTTTFVLQIKANLSKETATHRALLASVLKSATEQFPSRKEIRLYLDDLYGASFSADVARKGENHIISLKFETANEKFLKDDSSLFTKSIQFLKEVLENPYFEGDNQFSEKIVREEKRTLKQKMASIYDDKIRYANKRLVEEMCKGEAYAVHPFGDQETLDTITSDDLKQEYERLLQEDDIRLYIVGDIDVKQAEEAAQIFSVTSRNASSALEEGYSKKDKVNEVTETDDIQQGKLHLGYRTEVMFNDERFPAMQVMNGLFGGFPHSKLFMNVREKESMAYYAASRYESLKGLMFVFAGIEAVKYEKAVDIIKKQLEDMKEGQFSEEAVEQTKGMVKNQLLETADSARGLVELSYQHVIAGSDRSLSDWLKAIDKVSKDDVIKAAQTVELDTSYFLRGKEVNHGQ